MSLSLNVLNDLICRSADGNLDEFTSLQTSSEIFRVVASVLICPIVGFISDILMNFWKKYKNGSVDVLYSFPCYLGMTVTAVCLGVSLIWTNIWPTMTFIAFLNGLIYTFENMCIVQSLGFTRAKRTVKTKWTAWNELSQVWVKLANPDISFPINSHGIMFAIVELTSSLINFSQIPITDAVKLNQDFDLLTYLLIGLSLVIVIRNIFEIIKVNLRLGPELILADQWPPINLFKFEN